MRVLGSRGEYWGAGRVLGSRVRRVLRSRGRRVLGSKGRVLGLRGMRSRS